MTGPNGATYELTRTAKGQTAVRVTHPKHFARLIVTGYSGHAFESPAAAEAWAAYDGRLEYAPGEPAFRRAVVS